MSQVVGFSGGKDSTALALRLAELGEPFTFLFTPTGDELPALLAHISRVVGLVGAPLAVRSCGASLSELIRQSRRLPNHRQRWCTRRLKIETAKAYLLERPGSVLLVGLRADEEEREGMFGAHATYRYPLREWGWGLREVRSYLDGRGVQIPERTDCALCYAQRLGEWYRLWRDHPDRWAEGESLEALTGHTFRSPQRDSWPASMRGLRAEFERGRKPRGADGVSLPLFGEGSQGGRCRVCEM